MNTRKNPARIEMSWMILRSILGSIFIYAAIDKIFYPEQFAHALSNYKILPQGTLNFIALLLPWAEVVIGVFLILGLYEWTSLTLFNGLMLIFLSAIAISLLRGLNISCGCFESDPNAEKMSWLTLMRDSFILLFSFAGYFFLSRLKRPPFLR